MGFKWAYDIHSGFKLFMLILIAFTTGCIGYPLLRWQSSICGLRVGAEQRIPLKVIPKQYDHNIDITFDFNCLKWRSALPNCMGWNGG